MQHNTIFFQIFYKKVVCSKLNERRFNVTKQPAIELKNITKVFGKVIANKNVNLTAYRGEILSILGENGSGKTTLMNMISGIYFPDEGDILFDGKSTKELNCDVYRRDDAAVIYQNYNLFPLLTAEENVAYPLRLKKMSKAEASAKAREELRAVGIEESEFSRFPSQLSGGQQQRVSIARALAAGNRVILADEPTGNLDSKNGREIMELLSSLNAEGTTIVMVTHSRHDATYAHRIMYLYDGQEAADMDGLL